MFQISKTVLALISGIVLITFLGVLIPAFADVIGVLLVIPLILLAIGFSLAFTACFLPPVWIYMTWYLFKKKQ